jgi:hypothetical protein
MIWIPHPEEGYLPGKVSRDCGDGSCEVTTNEGEARAPTPTHHWQNQKI